MFAVIKTGGKQYRVAANDLLKVEKVAGNAGDIVEFAEVLMVGVGADATIGAPVVGGALVTAEVVEQGRARKVIAFKKRRRQNSKRTRGHRQELTTIRISEILTDGAKPSKKVAEKPAKKEAAPKAKPLPLTWLQILARRKPHLRLKLRQRRLPPRLRSPLRANR